MSDVDSVRVRLEDVLIDVLGVDRADLAGASLRELGVSSVNAVMLVEEINARFDRTFPSSLVFEFDDLPTLARYVAGQAHPAASRPFEPAPAADPGADAAIVGIACRAAGVNDPDQLWEVVSGRRECLRELTEPAWLDVFRRHCPQAALPRYGAMADTDAFDSAFFRISPREAAAMNPAQRVLLEECYHALEDAAIDPASLRGRAVATVIGTSSLTQREDYSAHALMGADASVMAGRLAYHLDLGGPALAVDTACSSSLVAVDMARRMVRRGDAEIAIAGGVSVCAHPGFFVAMENLGTMSAQRVCRPFDDAADGMLLGEGVGVVVLKRLADAVRDNDRIYGVIRAGGSNQDGRSSGITAPSYLAQARLIAEVYRRGGIDPDRLRYFEAHGTGTKLGDPVEIAALTEAFAEFTDRRQFCAIGSVKANIGHTTAAAGVLGLIKVLLAMRHGELPPAANFARANEQIDFARSPVYVNREPCGWPREESGRRLAAVSSFGYSGTNAHVVVEQLPDPAPVPAAAPQVVPLSAQCGTQLRLKAEQLLAYLRAHRPGDADLPAVAHTLQVGREAMAERAAAVVSSMAELTDLLAGVGEESGWYRGNAGGEPPAPAGPHELAARWSRGEAVDWSLLHPGGPPPRLSLPGHPFRRTKHPLVWTGAASGPVAESVLSEVDNAVAAQLARDADATSLDIAVRATELNAELNDLSRHLLVGALRRMGLSTEAGQVWRPVELLTRLGIVADHTTVFHASLDILAGAGFLRRTGDGLVCTGELDVAARHWDTARLRRRVDELSAGSPDSAGFLRLLERCVNALPDVLTGRRTAQEILFPGGDIDALADVYHSNRDTNAIVATAVAAFVSARDPDRTLSVVEVGAGTGGTSAAVLPALRESADRVSYAYTDISRSFTQFGARRYGPEHPFARFTPLDIERPPAAQGFPAGGADVVIAGNVLHATASVPRTLDNVAALLRPGGLLVVMEATQSQDYYTLTFGLTTGWWAFEDQARLPGSPLLSASMWRQALERSGFRSVRTVSRLALREDQAPESVIIAERDGTGVTPAVQQETAAPPARRLPVLPAPTPPPRLESVPAGAPGSAIERMVTDAWRQVLGVDEIGLHEDFQTLGGDSILATQIISRLKSGFPFEVELGALFEATTVEEMARLVTAEVIGRIEELPEDAVRSLLV